MKQIWIIAKRELQNFFDSLIAYLLLGVFLVLTGLFTWILGSDIFLVNQATMRSFFDVAYWTFFFFTPALTMKMIAEERKSGTLELLLTKAVSDWQLILGKYLACLMLVAIAILSSLPYYITIANLGPIDHGAVWCGYLGVLLMSSAYIGIGMFSSSTTNNQIVAFLLSLFIGSFFLIVFTVLASSLSGKAADLVFYLSMSTHFESIARGVIDSRDLVYFLSITFFGLLMAELVLAKRNIRA
ncbi:MAG: ABC transporter permease subunit [Bacteroidetes bacterium]|nr:ABC transporter permease subunit [Bacteroidota bacterium]